jgi:hypothetical protein
VPRACGYCGTTSDAFDRALSSSCSFLIPRHPPVDHSDPSYANMGNIKAAIDALKTVSIVCAMVPVVGENLKSAVELASTICEQVQVRPSNLSHMNQVIHDGFDSLNRP